MYSIQRAFCVSLFVAGFGSASAQTQWGIEGTGPSYGEFNSPPLCTVPPPYMTNTPPIPPPGCRGNGAFSPDFCRIGGSAVDNDGNVFSGGSTVPAMVHTDGFAIEMTDYDGNFILSMEHLPGDILPNPISGLGYDSADDIIWIIDNGNAAGIGLAPCAAPPVIFGPFALPVTAFDAASGVGWDPCTGSLWFAECGGRVVNVDTTGAFIDAFAATDLTDPLVGLSINTTNGNIQVTDGTSVAEYTPAGVLAATGPFYLTANPYPIALWGGTIDGLGFSLRPQNYGAPCPAGGPEISFFGGYPYAGNAGFGLMQTGATPTWTSILLLSLSGYACPPTPIAGCPAGTGLWLQFPTLPGIPAGIVPAAGTTSVALPLPPPLPPDTCNLPVGVNVVGQFINFGGGSIETTDAITFTIGLN